MKFKVGDLVVGNGYVSIGVGAITGCITFESDPELEAYRGVWPKSLVEVSHMADELAEPTQAQLEQQALEALSS